MKCACDIAGHALRAWPRFASLPEVRDTVEGSSTRQAGVLAPEPGCCLETDPDRAGRSLDSGCHLRCWVRRSRSRAGSRGEGQSSTLYL